MRSEEGAIDQPPARGRLAHRTAQLPFASRVLYAIEHSISIPAFAITVMVVVVCVIAGGGALFRFSTGFVAGFEVTVSAMTLMMVFAIQHTQAREQAATQRKLDELLRAIPGADSGLMMLEEASQDVMLHVEEDHRDAHADVIAEREPS